MSNMSTMVFFMAFFNLLLVLIGLSIVNIDPTSNVCYTADKSLLRNFEGNTTFSRDPTEVMPSSNQGSVSSSNPIIDWFSNIISGIKNLPIIREALGVLSAPYTVFNCVPHAPEYNIVINLVAGLWYFISALILAAFIWWRD